MSKPKYMVILHSKEYLFFSFNAARYFAETNGTTVIKVNR